MLVDGNNRFVSQRKFPKLATVRCKFTTTSAGGTRHLHVSAPGMGRELEFAPRLSGERIEVGIWQDKVRVIDQGEGPAQWFSELIGHGGAFIRLVSSAESGSETPNKSDEMYQRPVTNLPSGLKGRLPTMNMALVDDGPVSLVSMESLADVNRRMRERETEEVPVNQFRMNIEITGCSKPFEEDDWLLIKIGSAPFLLYTNAEVGPVWEGAITHPWQNIYRVTRERDAVSVFFFTVRWANYCSTLCCQWAYQQEVLAQAHCTL
jgi:uncharacterized protein YcbX